jgi:hypothetical protein
MPNMFESFSVLGTGADSIIFNFRNDPGYLALDDVSFSPFAVREPSSFVLAGIGGTTVAGCMWRRRRRATD